jgi:excisionase family DNA binding protein
MAQRDDYVTLQEAATLLGVSRTRMWQLATEHKLRDYALKTDRRMRLFLRSDVLALQRPEPGRPAPERGQQEGSGG